MKAEDLMINDLVRYGSPVIVTEIMMRDRYAVIGINKHGEHEQVLDNELSPIPLTPEILEKNGLLEGISSEYWMVYSKHDEIWYFHYIGAFTDVKIGITDVHELQHALRLCGIEKEIVL